MGCVLSLVKRKGEAGKQGQGPELNRMEKQAEHEDSPAWLPTEDAT